MVHHNPIIDEIEIKGRSNVARIINVLTVRAIRSVVTRGNLLNGEREQYTPEANYTMIRSKNSPQKKATYGRGYGHM